MFPNQDLMRLPNDEPVSWWFTILDLLKVFATSETNIFSQNGGATFLNPGRQNPNKIQVVYWGTTPEPVKTVDGSQIPRHTIICMYKFHCKLQTSTG